MQAFTHKTGHFIESDTAKIYFEEIGNKNKPVLLMLHGGFENIEDLNPIAGYLADQYRIIGIDSRGHGKSTLGTIPLTYAQLQADTEAVLKYLGITAANILGFSDGGTVAYRIAITKNISIQKLITIGATWSNDDVLANETVYQALTPEKIKTIFVKNFTSYQQLNPEADWVQFSQFVVSMWRDLATSGHPNETVAKIDAATLLIRGDNDFLVSLKSLATLKEKIKNSSLLNIPFAKHLVHIEQATVCEIVISQFLKNS